MTQVWTQLDGISVIEEEPWSYIGHPQDATKNLIFVLHSEGIGLGPFFIL